MAQATWKDYFSFSKKERIAIVILLIIIGVFIILPFFFTRQFKKPEVDHALQQQLFAAQYAKQQKETVTDTPGVDKGATNKSISNTLQLFYFDPNTLDSAGWKRIGLTDKTTHMILTYRNKGGIFKQPDDLRKIYGLKKAEADLLIPYIQIKSINETKPTNEVHNQPRIISDDNKQTSPAANSKKIDVNTATAEEFKSLPGIGDVLSNRIIKFRSSIHGFKSIEDIRKTYGLSDSTYQVILPYLTINSITQNKLARE